jgi:CDP-diacylglycerol--serine O-phosphatidyltransferase
MDKSTIDEIFPPFEPEPGPQRRLRTVPMRVLIPNLVTLMALASGLTSVRFAIEGRLEHAALALVAAALLDGLDGRIARMLKGTSRFGAELDSLADFVSFGCAPALILYFWKLQHLKSLGWLACLLLAFAMALRLARFNVMIDAPERPAWQKAYAMGVPAPAGAMLALLPLNISLSGFPAFAGDSVLVLLWTVACAALCISRLPTFSGKGIGPVPRNRVIPLLAVALIVLALLLMHPFESISALTLVYIAGIPLAYRRFRLEDLKAAAPANLPVPAPTSESNA